MSLPTSSCHKSSAIIPPTAVITTQKDIRNTEANVDSALNNAPDASFKPPYAEPPSNNTVSVSRNTNPGGSQPPKIGPASEALSAASVSPSHALVSQLDEHESVPVAQFSADRGQKRDIQGRFKESGNGTKPVKSDAQKERDDVSSKVTKWKNSIELIIKKIQSSRYVV